MNNKPTPKTQRSMSRDLREEYQKPESPILSPLTNPPNETGVDFNRGEKVSFRNDTTKPLSIGLEDIDTALFYYFENVIQPNVIQNGERINVPLIYSGQERWKSFRRDGVYRDAKGALMSPIIAIKRESVKKDRNITNKLDANHPKLNTTLQKHYTPENSYSNFSALTNRVPTQTLHNVIVPDYVTIEYSCIVQTYYTSQLNNIVEAIEYASDSYWGEPERFKFRTRIDNFQMNSEIVKGKDRSVSSTFSITLNGYLIPNTIQKDLTSNKKLYSKSKITITNETIL